MKSLIKEKRWLVHLYRGMCESREIAIATLSAPVYEVMPVPPRPSTLTRAAGGLVARLSDYGLLSRLSNISYSPNSKTPLLAYVTLWSQRLALAATKLTEGACKMHEAEIC